LDFIWADLKHACRTLVSRPAFTAILVITLALGIGVNSAVFALLDGVLWRSLPYRDPSRLVFVWQTLPEHNVAELEPTPFDFEAWHRVQSFESLALIATDTYTLAGDDNPERVRGARITSSLMPLLGIAPRVGRTFETREDDDGAAPTAILSDGLWKRRYGGDQPDESDKSIVGRRILINGVQTTVIGIMPASALLPGPLAANDDLWLPARLTPSERTNAISHNYTVVARLASGFRLERAAREVDAFAKRLAADEPDSHHGIGARVVTFDEQTVRNVRPSLMVAAGGVALLLLVTCANASTLLLAREANRRHETAVRAALGATRPRLLSLAVIESLALAGLGGLAGLAFGNWALRFLVPLFSASLPATATVDIDGRVASFTAALSVILGLTFGLARVFTRFDGTLDALKGSSRTATADSAQSRTRNVLLVAQIAFAVTLMCAAGLMLQSVVRLSRVSPGFDATNVLSFRLSLTGSSYADGASRLALVRQLIDRIAAAPGIQRAGVTSNIPFGGSRGANGVEIEGRPVTRGESIVIDQRYVTPDYFQTMRVPLVIGRMLSETDDERGDRVVMINRTMARRYFPASSPIDRRVRVTAGVNAHAWCRIVGVVEDVRHIALSGDAVPEMYYPYAQAPVATFAVVARTATNPAAATPALREALRAADPALPMYDVRTMEDRIARSMAQTRATMLLLLVTGALAATLAAIAIYGSVWYSVSTRTPEIGIRLALGATPASVCGGILRNALSLSAVGAGIGAVAMTTARPLLASFLVDAPTTDVTTFASVIGALFAVTALACLVPAWRAMHVDPVVALRNE
jgi:putative ABC transport system permease protein